MDKFELLCLFEAISNYAYDIHYTAKGRYFFSDHLFSERLSDVDVKDDFIETFYLGKSEEAPSSADIARKVATLTPQITDNTQDNFKRLRDMIIRALMTIQKYDGTKGEEDILGAIAHILQRHNGLLYRQLTYTPEEIRNDNSDWREIVGEEDTTQTLDNEKWITVHPNKENPDDYRRLKVEDGETSKEAVERKYGKDKDEKKETEKAEKGDNKSLHDMTDEQLTKMEDDAEEKVSKYFEAKEKAKEEYKKIKELKEYIEETRKKYWEVDYASPEGERLRREINRAEEAYRQAHSDFEDEYNKEHNQEYNEIAKRLSDIRQERYERENQKELVSQRKREKIDKKIDDLMTKSDDLSDEEYEKQFNDIKQEIKDTEGLVDWHRQSLLDSLSTRSEVQRFDRKVNNMKKI